MIRTGFVLPHDSEAWLGGAHYLRNLLGAIAAASDCGVQPVLLRQPGARVPQGFDGVEIVQSVALRLQQQFMVRNLLRLLGTDPLLDAILVHHRVELLSHSGVLGPRARTPAIAWISDLQHRAYPEFFQRRERDFRDALFAKFLREAALVVVSSEAARADVDHFFPGHAAKLRVLRFVDGSMAATAATPRELLEARYAFQGRYFVLPNQYWVHKNHAVVLEALAILQRSSRKVLVISTGSPGDYRQPGHFERLMRRRAELGLEESYRVLGVVPFPDLAGLLRHSVAVINPSLFEGWSSSVEEAKSLGKRVVLSDLPVHREQAPERAIYFDPESPEELAEAIWGAWSADPAQEAAEAGRAALALPGRRRGFAEEYAALAREACVRAPDGR